MTGDAEAYVDGVAVLTRRVAELETERDEFRAAHLLSAQAIYGAAMEQRDDALAELAELRVTLAQLAAKADARLADEYADRQMIAENLIDRLIVLSGGGK